MPFKDPEPRMGNFGEAARAAVAADVELPPPTEGAADDGRMAADGQPSKDGPAEPLPPAEAEGGNA